MRWNRKIAIEELDWKGSSDPKATDFKYRALWDETTPENHEARINGPYGTLCEFGKGGSWPPFEVIDGVVEVIVVEGTFGLNDAVYRAGDWIRFGEKNVVWAPSSPDGGIIFSAMRGRNRRPARDGIPMGVPPKAEPDVVRPAEMVWKPSPTGAWGCYGKKIFNYSETGLGQHGRAGGYTCLYRYDQHARYPSFRVTEGACEIGILRGSLDINGAIYLPGDWVQLRAGKSPWSLRALEDCEVIAFVRGAVELGLMTSIDRLRYESC